MSDNLRQRRLGSPYRCGARRGAVALAALVLSSPACARFGYDLLDPSPDSGIGGRRLIATSDAADAADDVRVSEAGSGDASPGGASGSCAACVCTFDPPERLVVPNGPGNDLWSPALSSDGLSLYFGVTVPGLTEQIARSTRSDRAASFGLWQALPAPINQGTEGSPHLSADALSLYFYSRRAGGVGSRDLYVATRARPADEFDGVTLLSNLNSAGLDHQPWISLDQLRLYFVSDRSGNVDVWRSTRSSNGTVFDPPQAVSELNTTSEEGGVSLSPDELEAILTSNRPGGAGARDLYRSSRSSTSELFSSPVPIVELNTSDNEIDPELSADGVELYFASNRGGGTSSLYRAVRRCTR